MKRDRKYWWLEGVNIGNYIYIGTISVDYGHQTHSLYVLDEYDPSMTALRKRHHLCYNDFKKIVSPYDLSEYRKAGMKSKRQERENEKSNKNK